MILRDRDTSGGGDGTLDERVYYLQNWRADVVALISDAGAQVEQVRYEPYGTPFGIPAGDVDASGAVDGTDATAVTAWYNAPSYDVRGDLDMDNDVDLSDITAVAAAKTAGDTLGLHNLSLVENRKGYAGYELLGELSEAKWDVRNRVLNSSLGKWNRRDPLGQVDGPSLYRYAQSPLAATDPMGLYIARPSWSHSPLPVTTDPYARCASDPYFEDILLDFPILCPLPRFEPDSRLCGMAEPEPFGRDEVALFCCETQIIYYCPRASCRALAHELYHAVQHCNGLPCGPAQYIDGLPCGADPRTCGEAFCSEAEAVIHGGQCCAYGDGTPAYWRCVAGVAAGTTGPCIGLDAFLLIVNDDQLLMTWLVPAILACTNAGPGPYCH